MTKQTPIEKIISLYDAQLVIPKNKTPVPFILCPVGQVGAGKTTITKPLAEQFSLVRISSDEIRTILKEGQYDYIQEEIRVIEFTLLRKYLELGHGVAYDTNCSTKRPIIDKLQEKFDIPVIWLHINPPEEFIVNKLKNFKHTFLFKDADQAVNTYFKDKISLDDFDRAFLCVFDTSKENLDLQITEANKLIKESLNPRK